MSDPNPPAVTPTTTHAPAGAQTIASTTVAAISHHKKKGAQVNKKALGGALLLLVLLWNFGLGHLNKAGNNLGVRLEDVTDPTANWSGSMPDLEKIIVLLALLAGIGMLIFAAKPKGKGH